MPKKRVKKKTSAKPKTSNKTSGKNPELEKSLAKNIVELQKIHVDLVEKFDKLAREISNLLALFEVTARNFAKNTPIGEFEKDKEFLEKIDKLLDQNKTLAKGLTLMEERLRERMYGGHNPPPSRPTPREPLEEKGFEPPMTSENRPLPRF